MFQCQSCRKFPTTQVIRLDFPVMDVMEKGTVSVKCISLFTLQGLICLMWEDWQGAFFQIYFPKNFWQSLHYEALVNPYRVTQCWYWNWLVSTHSKYKRKYIQTKYLVLAYSCSSSVALTSLVLLNTHFKVYTCTHAHPSSLSLSLPHGPISGWIEHVASGLR